MEDFYLSDIRVHGISNGREEKVGPVHLHFSKNQQSEEMSPRFSEAVFQSARILSRRDSHVVKEQTKSYEKSSAPALELLYLSNDGNHGVGVTILFHQSGPSVICYSKASPQKKASHEELSYPDILQSMCIGYKNRYSYFNLPFVEENCQN